MSKSLQDLGLKDEPLPTAGQDLTDLPEFGTWAPPPQPGPFRFKLPSDMSSVYDVFDVDSKGQRIKIIFDREHPLLIVQSLGGKYNGQPFESRLTNNERERGKKGSGVIASDADYLLRALGHKTKPPSNRGYIEALRSTGGKEFGADIRYSWRCDTKRDIRVRDAQGAVQVVEGQKGCNEAYYQEDVEKLPDGTYPHEIACQCGALLRAFANLDNMRP